MKKKLIVALAFYPKISVRSLRAAELANEIFIQGLDVTIVTPNNLHIPTDIEHKHKVCIQELGKIRWESQDIESSKNGRIITRALSRLFSFSFEYPIIEI